MSGKLRVAVLMGGTSAEREISLKSGKAVSAALTSLGHDVIDVDLRSETGSELRGIKIDVAFIAMHGPFGEDGRLQAILEQAGIPYTGSAPRACAHAMDKNRAKMIFRGKKIPTPRWHLFDRTTSAAVLSERADELAYPVVIKPNAQGSTVGVSLHPNSSTLVQGALRALQYGEGGILEKAVRGREMTVGILDGRPLPIVEIQSPRSLFDYDAKYTDPATRTIADPSLGESDKKRIQRAALEAHQVLDCEGFSRVDLIDDGETPWILEVNAVPGLTERSLFPMAAQALFSFPELCQKLVELALKRAGKSSRWAAAL